MKGTDVPGNILLQAKTTKLPKDSVALVAQVITFDQSVPAARFGKLTPELAELNPSSFATSLSR